MAATATSSSTGVRYAPDDPTLPKPWRGLVDGKTGYLYFWNPETNTTQYERPVASSHATCVQAQKCLSSSVEKSLQGHHNDNDDDDKRNGEGCNGGPTKVDSSVGTYQNARRKSDYSLDDSDVNAGVGHGSYASKSAECGLSAESYRRHHEITVNGDNVPQPFTSFQATGFPSEILREVDLEIMCSLYVRYLLQEGANVLHYTAFWWCFACIWTALIDGPIS